MEERPPIWRVAVNTLNKQPLGPPAWGLGEVLTTPLRKKHMLKITHNLRCFLWRQNNPDGKIKTNEMGRACGAYGGG